MSSAFSKPAISARLKATKTCGMKNVLRNEEGAIDLASIMVGVVVIGIVGSVIAATVFAVIPWAQDQAASQSLDAVKTAQSVAYAGGAVNGGTDYLEKADLVNGKAGNELTAKPLLQDSDAIAIVTNDGGYFAVAKSASGTYFGLDSDDPSTIVKYDTLVAAQAGSDAGTGGTTVLDFASAKTP